MPRKPPIPRTPALRRSDNDARNYQELPSSVVAQLRRLNRDDLRPMDVENALAQWRRMSTTSARGLIGRGRSDTLEFIGPMFRHLLAEAIRALPTRESRILQSKVAPLDAAIQQRTLPDPTRPTELPWWNRLLVD